MAEKGGGAEPANFRPISSSTENTRLSNLRDTTQSSQERAGRTKRKKSNPLGGSTWPHLHLTFDRISRPIYFPSNFSEFFFPVEIRRQVAARETDTRWLSPPGGSTRDDDETNQIEILFFF